MKSISRPPETISSTQQRMWDFARAVKRGRSLAGLSSGSSEGNRSGFREGSWTVSGRVEGAEVFAIDQPTPVPVRLFDRSCAARFGMGPKMRRVLFHSLNLLETNPKDGPYFSYIGNVLVFQRTPGLPILPAYTATYEATIRDASPSSHLHEVNNYLASIANDGRHMSNQSRARFDLFDLEFHTADEAETAYFDERIAHIAHLALRRGGPTFPGYTA